MQQFILKLKGDLLLQPVKASQQVIMGQGGYLWIINATSRTMRKIYQHSHQMDSWDFNDIPSQFMVRCYIEFHEGLFKKESEDVGEVTYQLDGTDQRFQVRCVWPLKTNECGLTVHWLGIDKQTYAVFPPPPSSESSVGELGWMCSGYLSMIVLEKGVKASVVTSTPTEGSIIRKTSTLPFPRPSLLAHWMGYYSDVLGNLTLAKMTLPGTHNSGTFDPERCLGSPWIKTQEADIGSQLKMGVRVLDLQVGQCGHAEFLIANDVWRTSYTLLSLLKEVKEFIDSAPKEIVVLDVCHFIQLEGGEFDYNELRQQIEGYLDGYLLSPRLGQDTPLAEIWSRRDRQRVVVAWNGHLSSPSFWPGIARRNYSEADSKEKLFAEIERDMKLPLKGLWATCSIKTPTVVATPKVNAYSLDPTITRWYFGGSTWCCKANIISVDFFDECSNIVQAAIIGSLLKAGTNLS